MAYRGLLHYSPFDGPHLSCLVTRHFNQLQVGSPLRWTNHKDEIYVSFDEAGRGRAQKLHRIITPV
jgi:hypothetical protein